MQIPKNVLLLGDKGLLKSAIPKFKAKKIQEWKGKNFPLYKFELGTQTFGLSHYYYGASAAAVNLEDLIGNGGENFIFLTLARPIADDIKAGNIVLPTRAIRDEGTSFHYLKPAKQVIGNIEIEKKLKEELKKNSLSAKIGLTWTTDSPYSKVRKTREIIESKAFTIDNDSAAMFAVARYRNVFLGGMLLVSEASIRGKLKEKVNDPLKELKAHLLGVCADTLNAKTFWQTLREEKQKEKTYANTTDPRTPIWDSKIEELEKQIDNEITKIGASEKAEDLVDAFLIKKEIFVSEYHRNRSKYIRKKIGAKTYNRVSNSCILVLEKILAKIKELLKRLQLLHEKIEEKDKMKRLRLLIQEEKQELASTEEIAEEIYAQLAEGEEPGFYKSEEAPPMSAVHKNIVSVFLVNLPRRFRYKPYYKKFFEEEPKVVSHEEFLEKY